jgi:hypothetical protein
MLLDEPPRACSQNIVGEFMPRKKRPEPDDKEQSARFIEAAKQIEEPLSKKAFREVFDKIVKKKRVSKAQR